MTLSPFNLRLSDLVVFLLVEVTNHDEVVGDIDEAILVDVGCSIVARTALGCVERRHHREIVADVNQTITVNISVEHAPCDTVASASVQSESLRPLKECASTDLEDHVVGEDSIVQAKAERAC